jgi:hypothetical protein
VSFKLSILEGCHAVSREESKSGRVEERERERERARARERAMERKRVVIVSRQESKRGVRLRPKKRTEERERGVCGCVERREKRAREREARETVSAVLGDSVVSVVSGEER